MDNFLRGRGAASGLRPTSALRRLPLILLVLVLTAVAAVARAQSGPSEYVAAAADEVVANFRRQIALHEAGPVSRTLTQAGQYLFFRNRQLIAQLVDYLVQPPPAQSEQRINALLELLDARKDWRDIDQLALLGVINETRVRLPAGPLAARLQKKREEIIAVRAAYNREVTAALDRTSGAGGRVEWNAYVAFLREQYPVARILDDLKAVLPDSAPAARSDPRVARALDDEWTDGGLPPKTVLLTFDDGPHPQYTVEILQILAHYGLHAIFFQIGQNLGPAGGARAEVTRNAAVVAEILRDGHAIANHSYTHPVLPKLANVQIDDEIDSTQGLLVAAAPGSAHVPLFRPPYGARNDLVLTEIAARGLRSVLWNIDSRDWADPIPQSIAQRVIDEAAREGRGIILFHDIHGRSVQALPIAIEGLLKRGFRFAHWDRESGVLAVDLAAPAR